MLLIMALKARVLVARETMGLLFNCPFTSFHYVDERLVFNGSSPMPVIVLSIGDGS